MKSFIALTALAVLLVVSAAYGTPGMYGSTDNKAGVACPAPVTVTPTPAPSMGMQPQAGKGTAVAGEAFQVRPNPILRTPLVRPDLYPPSERNGVPPVYNF